MMKGRLIPGLAKALAFGGFIACLVAAMPVYAQSILVSDFNGTEPALHTPWTPISYLDPNISYSGWRLGQGAIPTPGINNALAFYFSATSVDSNLAEAIRDKEYVYFSIQPTTGTLNLSGKKVNFDIQRIDWWAPRTYVVFTSVAGFAEGSQLFTTASLDNGDYANHQFSFIIPPAGYDGLTGTIEFRIYGFEARYDGHDTSLTAFSIEQASPVRTLNLTSDPGGTASSNPQGTYFEQGTTIQLLASPDAGYHFAGWSGDINGLGNPRTIVLDANLNITANFTPNPPPQMTIGMNLGSIDDWATDWVFVDQFKMARIWMTREVNSYNWESNKQDEIPLDANGWPTHLPFTASDGNQHYVHTITPAYVSGTYTVIVDGAGQISFSNAASATFNPAGGTNTYTITVPSGKQGPTSLFVDILQSSASDPIRNLRIIMPGFETTYQAQPFHPLYLERLQSFTALRFMDWGKTNNSPLVSWADRTTANSYTQTRPQGASLEYMIQLANTLMKNPWICIPHQADDNYVRQAARLLRDGVDPNLKIYVEYSNETWNSGFPQTTYVQDMGQALDPDRWTAGQKYCSLRSIQIWEIFNDEFEGNSRLIKVMATQSSNTTITNIRFDALNDPAINPNYTMPDVLAIAPYFGIGYSPSDIPPAVPNYPTIDEILQTISPAEINNVRGNIISQKAAADTQGNRLVCYEAGQGFVGVGEAVNDDTLTNILTSANRDQLMYDRYIEYLNMLKATGVDMCGNFSFVDAWSKWGSFSVLEYQDQPIDQAPKYRALVNWINAKSRGDFDASGYVDLPDLATLCSQWLTPGLDADLDESGMVDFRDFALFGQNWCR
jgi:uncharacterized repeat protein (TIGR02543 family)